MRRLNPWNAAGVGQPEQSAYGQAVRGAMGRLAYHEPPVVPGNVRDGARGFRDRFGVMLNTVPMPPPLVAPSQLTGYTGRLPLGILPRMTRPHAWEL